MRKLFILILSSIATLAYGQEMSVKSFYLAETDLTANTPGTMVYDPNGNVCALIKLETTQKGFTFDVGISGVMSTVEKTGEIWVYVPFGIRRISIMHPQLGVIRDYPLPCAIEKGRTYIMTLVTGTVRTIVEYASTKQFLQIEITPSDAILEVNGKIKLVDGGVYNELLPFGRYQYKVYCKNYHDLIGVVEVSDPDNTHRLKLKLRPAFGHISILEGNQADLKGAAVYIDEQYMGTIPLRNIQISSGTHSIRVIKELYEAYTENFVISDEERLELNPNLTPDFAEVTLVTSKEADIYINGDFKGKHTWTGKLVTGSYIFESKQNGHISSERSYDISRENNQRTIQLQSPTPIYGSLIISSRPSNAKISINGKHIGETPKYISKQVIGEYRISVELNGYKTQTKTINVTEGNEASLSFTLEKAIAQHPSHTNASLERTIYSKETTINVGELITAELNGRKVEKWGIGSAYSQYITTPTKGKIQAIKEGYVEIWGDINGVPKLFKLRIINTNRSVPSTNIPKTIQTNKSVPSTNIPKTNQTNKSTTSSSNDKSTIYSREATIKVGELITAELNGQKVERWGIGSAYSQYITTPAKGKIQAIRKGYVEIWGDINGVPRLFKIKIE